MRTVKTVIWIVITAFCHKLGSFYQNSEWSRSGFFIFEDDETQN